MLLVKGFVWLASLSETAGHCGRACAALGSCWKLLHAMQGSSGLNSFLSRVVPFMRDRLLADPRYCFIVLAEVGIDTGCATVAEVRCSTPAVLRRCMRATRLHV